MSNCYSTPPRVVSSPWGDDKCVLTGGIDLVRGGALIRDHRVFSPRGMVSPGGEYRRKLKQQSHHHNKGHSASPTDKKCRLDGHSLLGLKDRPRLVSKLARRAKQAMKIFLNIKKKHHRNYMREGNTSRKSIIKRPCTPYRRKRGVEFQYEDLTESFSDTSSLENHLRGGLRIQMTSVLKNEIYCIDGHHYDNYVAKLYQKDSQYVLELWKPLTGEVIENFFDDVIEIFFDEKSELIYVIRGESTESTNSISHTECEVAIRCRNNYSTRQLCLLLSMCHLTNIGVNAISEKRNNPWNLDVNNKIDEMEQLYSPLKPCAGILHTIHESGKRSKEGNINTYCFSIISTALSVVILLSMLRMSSIHLWQNI